jgi:hypothetical protein
MGGKKGVFGARQDNKQGWKNGVVDPEGPVRVEVRIICTRAIITSKRALITVFDTILCHTCIIITVQAIKLPVSKYISLPCRLKINYITEFRNRSHMLSLQYLSLELYYFQENFVRWCFNKPLSVCTIDYLQFSLPPEKFIIHITFLWLVSGFCAELSLALSGEFLGWYHRPFNILQRAVSLPHMYKEFLEWYHCLSFTATSRL